MGRARESGAHELGCYVEVPPGEYGVEVYSYPPGDLSSGWGHISDPDLFGAVPGIEAEAPIEYFRRTRPKENSPAWIKGEVDDTSYINFLVRLSPLQGQVLLPKLEEGDLGIEWEFRKPVQCPLGILAQLSAA
jgi:hypothetical protein